ncbi:MAG: cytochrome c-type biogenesis protein CcmH [Anaerolineales bacterium]
MMKRWYWILPLLLITLVFGVNTARAQGGTPHVPTDDEVNAIAGQLYCPVCESIPLDVCGTQVCAQWRELIREKLSQGWTADEIKAYFAEQYGDRVLAEPPRRGLNLMVYVLPPLLILVGAFVLFKAFRSWRTPLPEETVAATNAAPADDDYIRRLEEELKNR